MSDFFMNDRYRVLECMAQRQIIVNNEAVVKLSQQEIADTLGFTNPKDVISEQMIQSFKLSVNELLVCNEMSVSSLITAHRGYQTKLKDFKKAISDHCQEMGYI